MRITFVDNAGKGRMVAQALRSAGHELVGGGGDVMVCDHTIQTWGQLDEHRAAVLYPHGGNVQLAWDGLAPMHPNVRALLCHGPGHGEVHAAYGLGVECVDVGWSYGTWRDQQPGGPVRRVLFAPAHPHPNGYLPRYLRAANVRALAGMLTLDLEITVRLWPLTDAAGHGLDPDLPVTWTNGGGLDTTDIDLADMVVSDNGTVAHLALARGKTVMMIGSRHAPDIGLDSPFYPKHWAQYEELMAYPYDLDDPEAAAVGLADYRRRFVGGPFKPDAVVRAVENVAAWT